MTSCGNFAIAGYSTGHIDVFNLQSGKHRGSFEKDPENGRGMHCACVSKDDD